ncbi:MAG: hypothetical protein WDZ93_02465 [Candidatus Paceibacterota bacterium]
MNKKRITILVLGVGVLVCSTLFFYLHDQPRQPDVATVGGEEVGDNLPLGKKQYTHPSYLFSFYVSEEVQIESRYEAGGAETVVFTTPGTDPVQDFQLYIVPYSGSTITSSQIIKDTHGRAVTEPIEVVLGSGIRGIIFETEDPTLGRLREVWFLMNGHLYEATTHIAHEAWLAGILDTLEPNRP